MHIKFTVRPTARSGAKLRVSPTLSRMSCKIALASDLDFGQAQVSVTGKALLQYHRSAFPSLKLWPHQLLPAPVNYSCYTAPCRTHNFESHAPHHYYQR